MAILNSIEVSGNIITSNMRNNRRTMVTIFLLFVVFGVIFGIINVKIFHFDKNSNNYESDFILDMASIDRTETYYIYSYLEIKEKKDFINANIDYFKQVLLTDESKSKLRVIENEMIEYEDSFKNMDVFYSNNTPVIYDKRDLTKSFYENEIKRLNRELKNNSVRIEEMKSSPFIDAYKEATSKNYDEILILTNTDANLKININEYKNYIHNLESMDNVTLLSNCEQADVMLDKNGKKLEEIIAIFNDTMSEIATNENYEIIYNRSLWNEYFNEAGVKGNIYKESLLLDKKKDAIIYARSVNGLDMKKERFFSAFMFIMLVGAIIAIISGAFYKKEKKRRI